MSTTRYNSCCSKSEPRRGAKEAAARRIPPTIAATPPARMRAPLAMLVCFRTSLSHNVAAAPSVGRHAGAAHAGNYGSVAVTTLTGGGCVGGALVDAPDHHRMN